MSAVEEWPLTPERRRTWISAFYSHTRTACGPNFVVLPLLTWNDAHQLIALPRSAVYYSLLLWIDRVLSGWLLSLSQQVTNTVREPVADSARFLPWMRPGRMHRTEECVTSAWLRLEPSGDTTVRHVARTRDFGSLGP